jgi:predicted nucleotidyltransferase
MTAEVIAMVDVLEHKRPAIAELCARYGVTRLDVFGSALRDDFRPGESDVDLLVEFGPHEGYALVDAYFGLLDDLRALLGTEVDLLMADAVRNRYIAREIERTKQVLYAA